MSFVSTYSAVSLQKRWQPKSPIADVRMLMMLVLIFMLIFIYKTRRPHPPANRGRFPEKFLYDPQRSQMLSGCVLPRLQILDLSPARCINTERPVEIVRKTPLASSSASY